MNEIPAFQAIDLALGKNAVMTQPSLGWIVCEPGYYDHPQVFPDGRAVAITASPDEATELYCYAVEHSKYPRCVFVKPCWIHEQDIVYGHVSNRRHWTPR